MFWEVKIELHYYKAACSITLFQAAKLIVLQINNYFFICKDNIKNHSGTIFKIHRHGFQMVFPRNKNYTKSDRLLARIIHKNSDDTDIYLINQCVIETTPKKLYFCR